MTDPIVIVSAARTPIGGLQGDFKDITAPELGAVALRAALQRAKISNALIDETLMGCVLQAGLGQAPARQAALGGGLLDSCLCTTINKMCGSGLKAVMLGYDSIASGSAQRVLAGGMESMSNAPHLIRKSRAGHRLGNVTIADHMFLDGLEDAYDKGKLMGVFAEACARDYNFTREAQDAFALSSLARAKQATGDGIFATEIATVSIKTKTGGIEIDQDELPKNADAAKIPSLKAAFSTEGTITAASASSISDGAAAVLLMRASDAEKRGVSPLARIVAHSSHAQRPCLFTTAPVSALRKLSEKCGWTMKDVDLFEINEAFAVVTMAAMQELDLPHDKVNVYGGACALGHPIGASGARILVTLLNALTRRGMKRGMASLCIGGGEAVAIAVETL